MANDRVGNNALRPSAQTQYLASVSPDQVVINSALKRSLRGFLDTIPGFMSDFDAIDGSSAGRAALRNCQNHITRVKEMWKDGPVERQEILSTLAEAAQLLDETKQEVIEKIPELKPGRAEEVLARYGALLGFIACMAICIAAPFLAPTAGAIAGADFCGGMLFFASLIGHACALAPEEARKNLVDTFAPQLEKVRAAAVRAESAYTIEYIKARVSRVAAAHYEASLAAPLGDPASDASRGTESLPQWRVTADAEKSRLCLILLGIQTGAISIPAAQGRELLCKLLDAEALAQQQGLETDFQKNEAIRKDFLRLLDFLKYRPPVMQLIREGDAGENGIWAQGSEFERLLREHDEVIIDVGEQPASTQDRIRRDTGHAKARLGLPVGTAGRTRDIETAANDRVRKKADTRVRTPQFVVENHSETRVTILGKDAKPQDYFESIWEKIGEWFAVDDQDSARETLGCVVSERTTINDKLSSLELLRHLAKAEYKANFESEFDDDTVSLATEGVFTMTLNRRTRAIEFQPT